MASQNKSENTPGAAAASPAAPSAAAEQAPVAGFRPAGRAPGLRRLQITDEIMDSEMEAERSEKASAIHSMSPNQHTFAREARSLLMSRVPHLAEAELNVIRCEGWDVDTLMGGFTAGSTDILGALEISEDLAEAQRLVAENQIPHGWTYRLIHGGVFTHKLSRERKRKGLVFKNEITGFKETTGCSECVYELCPPDQSATIYYVAVQLHHLAECGDQNGEFFIFERAHAPAYRELIRESHRLALATIRKRKDKKNTQIDITNGRTLHMNDGAGWEDIVMSDAVRRSIHDDFSFFTSREAWFRRNRMPFKRGYLLVGPPGNGKTMIARAIASTPGLNAFTFDFTMRDHNNNSDLLEGFEKAASYAPSVFILEDIDRVFDNPGHTAVTKDGLLNCLDGIGTYDGVVVVATANHPEAIDPALLHRPGRFDRVIRVDNPDAELRYRQLHHLFSRSSDSRVSDQALRQAAEKSEGFSMADLKEIFVSAGCECCAEQVETISDGHLLKAFETIKAQFNQTARSSGFST